MPKREMRTFEIQNFQTRDTTETEPRSITGYAAVFNSRTALFDGLDEVIAPGAFQRAISNSDVRCLFDHKTSKVLGRTKSGTLRLREDDHGLFFEVDLPNTTTANNLIESMSRGDINQCSFGFIPTEETWDYSSEPVLRTINEVELYEVSIVTFPAYEQAEASLRNSQELQQDFEKRKQLIRKIDQALNHRGEE